MGGSHFYRSRVNACRGISLVELLSVAAVLSLLSAMSLPAIEAGMLRSELRSESQRLMSDLNYARTEAVKRNTVVIMASSADSADNWTDGWLIAADEGDANADISLAVGDAAAEGLSVVSSVDGAVIFSPTGSLAGRHGRVEIRICSEDAAISGRQVSINMAGFVSLRDISCQLEGAFGTVASR